MFCKFCGKRIDPSKKVCPYCSAPQETRSGGSGYWDILDDPAASASPARPAPTVQPVAPPLDGRLRAAIQKMHRTNLLAWVVVLACMLCALIVVTIAIRGSLVELSQRIDDVRQEPVEIAAVQSAEPLWESNVEHRLDTLAGNLSEVSANTRLILENSTVFDSARILELRTDDGKAVFIYKHFSTGGKWEYKDPAADWQDIPEQWKIQETTGIVSGGKFCLSLLIIEPEKWMKQGTLLRYQVNEDPSEQLLISVSSSPAAVNAGTIDPNLSAANSPGAGENPTEPSGDPATPATEPSEPSAPSGDPAESGSDTTPNKESGEGTPSQGGSGSGNFSGTEGSV